MVLQQRWREQLVNMGSFGRRQMGSCFSTPRPLALLTGSTVPFKNIIKRFLDYSVGYQSAVPVLDR